MNIQSMKKFYLKHLDIRNVQKLNIWQRYFFSVFVATTAAILGCIFLLYVVIDAMAHVKGITREFGSFGNACLYYGSTLAKRLTTLVPFASLIATIRCLFRFQSRGEFIALLSSGVSKRKILQPFLQASILFTAILFINTQFLLPRASRFIERFEESTYKFAGDAQPNEAMLHDGSKIIYSDYDPKTETLHDLFWIRSTDKIYHFKSLSLATQPPTGHWVDELARNKEGAIEKIASFKVLEMKEMDFTEKALRDSLIPASEQSLTQLTKQAFLYMHSSSTKAAELTSFLYYRLTSPLLTLLVFLVVAPFCLDFKRTSVMMIYLFSIAGLFCFHIILQTCFILAKSQVVPAILAIILPWVGCLYYFGKRYREIE